MKFLVDRGVLLRALDAAKGACVARDAGIFSHVVLTASGKENISVTSCNGDMQITAMALGDVQERGTVAAPPQLADIVKKLPEGCQVEISRPPGERLTLRSGRSRFVLPTLPPEDLPILAMGRVESEFEVDAAGLAKMLRRAGIAMAPADETRVFLAGVYLHLGGEPEQPELLAAATNGHMLARWRLPAPDGSQKMPGVILPRRSVTTLLRLLEQAHGGLAHVWITAALTRWEIGDVTMISKAIEGAFPDYQRVIPSGGRPLCVERAELIAAVERVAAVAGEGKSRGVAFSASKAAGLGLSARRQDGMEGSDALDASWEGAPLQVGFNVAYLVQILEALSGPIIELSLDDPAAPGVIRDPADPDGLFVCMPMRV